MNLSIMMEKWDILAYQLYNGFAYVKYVLDLPKYKKYLKKNAKWKNKYQGKRCFVVLNGPSLQNYDLSKVRDEFVFAVNTMYLSDVVDIIQPNFYCWSDGGIFNDGDHTTIDELLEKCTYAQFFFNKKYLNLSKTLPENVHITYSTHMPHSGKVRTNISRYSSNFMTVAFFAINIAIYMGFDEIYLLGLDFAPGGFKHFSDDLGEAENPDTYNIKAKVCGLHWGYSVAQYQSYYVGKEANRIGARIFNLNRSSSIRAFSFAEYEHLFGDGEK